ncbi:hypothetical protein XENOCAPTIV_013848 [Xenoophorus captivus]|uniref:Uncharacterized protein n=1 Tax=Xenoophorus captivus TaxID=1517983 RepID=A0ABV0RKR9_9TELE
MSLNAQQHFGNYKCALLLVVKHQKVFCMNKIMTQVKVVLIKRGTNEGKTQYSGGCLAAVFSPQSAGKHKKWYLFIQKMRSIRWSELTARCRFAERKHTNGLCFLTQKN